MKDPFHPLVRKLYEIDATWARKLCCHVKTIDDYVHWQHLSLNEMRMYPNIGKMTAMQIYAYFHGDTSIKDRIKLYEKHIKNAKAEIVRYKKLIKELK